MDIKALAKSKRSHTQHHNPKKPSSSNNQVKDKNKGPSLPSNWIRYQDNDEDEVQGMPFNSGSNEPSQLGTAKPKNSVAEDVVTPKSKGANYGDLIAQAKESRSYYSPLHDNLPDSYQGVAPMLAFRGENIFLQSRDDDFLMEDEGSGTKEAPFLTLDLKDLAERLSKVDLAKRLFVEPHLFPPEMDDQDENKASNPVKSHERHKIERIDSFGELLDIYLEEEQIAKEEDDSSKDIKLSSNLSIHHVKEQSDKPDSTETKIKLNNLEKSTHLNKELEVFEFLDKDKIPHVTHVNEQNKRPSSNFESASSEAELDMLLGSFNETKIFDTPINQLRSSTSCNSEHIEISQVKSHVGQSRPGFPVTSNLDDELDNLLAATSNLNDDKHGVLQSSSLFQPNSMPKEIDDFDSWMDSLS